MKPGDTDTMAYQTFTRALFNNPHQAASFHDVLVEIEDRKYSDEECHDAFNKLPRDIQLVAFEWGLSDTCFCDEAYTFLKDSKNT